MDFGWLVGWLVFQLFVCFWHDRAAKTLCFLTLPCQRSVITRDSTLALSLPAWILTDWERLFTFSAWLSGEDYFTLLSQCPENCLCSSYWSLSPSLTPKAVSDVKHTIPSPVPEGWLGVLPVPERSHSRCILAVCLTYGKQR